MDSQVDDLRDRAWEEVVEAVNAVAPVVSGLAEIKKNPTKMRSKNFTSTEITIMVEEVERRRNVLFGPLKGPRLTQFHMYRAWEKVVEAVAPVVRGLAEIKKKIRDLKTRTKQKANAFKREARKTGGGENDAVPLSAAEQRVLSFIGNHSIEGIEGGVDTFRKEVSACKLALEI
ncbi:Myb DNA-bind 5 domain containing protein [Asbolus verrucosus]|uniref:Regulatory protein zeste n=1 Tax=Asbolus verrucosus TaxID=1661398 RepID=A0A482W385_ASBVE|nr:Myb DNA-bind 5 domain containing protein [Asbolus verrucosus]